jgi:two-component system sensor kinase
MGELNENILKSIDSVLIVTDLQGRITQCNPIAAQFLGEEEDLILGSSVVVWPKLELVRGFPWMNPEARKIDATAIGDRMFAGYVIPLRAESQLGGPAPAATGAILVLDDLTDELALEERLRIAENLAAIGRMSAQVAHEVRNPLHSIGLEAELAAEMAAKLGKPELKQSLQSILAGVDRLGKITENYLKLSRLSAGEKHEVDLGSVLESVLATYSAVFESQRIEVDWRHEGSEPLLVRGDPDLLEQVLGNLLRNAIQALEATAEGDRRIRIAMGSDSSRRVWLRIEDSGPGVPDEIREKLFTPFVTTRAQGTGLGLSFVKKVLEDHGGEVKYVGATPRGASFELSLPGSYDISESAARTAEVTLNG